MFKRPSAVFTVFLFITGMFFLFPGHCQYADLVGKRTILDGSENIKKIAFALTEDAYKEVEYAIRLGSHAKYEEIFSLSDVLVLDKGVEVMVLDVEIFKNRAQIRVRTGKHSGMTGWVPMQWLNTQPLDPRFSDAKPE